MHMYVCRYHMYGYWLVRVKLFIVVVYLHFSCIVCLYVFLFAFVVITIHYFSFAHVCSQLKFFVVVAIFSSFREKLLAQHSCWLANDAVALSRVCFCHNYKCTYVLRSCMCRCCCRSISEQLIHAFCFNTTNNYWLSCCCLRLFSCTIFPANLFLL